MAMIIALAFPVLYTDFVKLRTWFFIVFLISSGLARAQEELPFWRNKTKLYTQIRDGRRVVVSVDTESHGREKKIRVSGVGVVNVPFYFTLEQVMRFEVLPQVSSYFKKVVHRKEKQEVYFFIKALGTQVRFLKYYKWGKKNQRLAQLDWMVTWGNLKGMVGHYRFRQVSPGKTEVVIWATLKRLDFPLPEFLLNFTLEVIAEKVAQKMRSFMEDNYRRNQSTDSKNEQK